MLGGSTGNRTNVAHADDSSNNNNNNPSSPLSSLITTATTGTAFPTGNTFGAGTGTSAGVGAIVGLDSVTAGGGGSVMIPVAQLSDHYTSRVFLWHKDTEHTPYDAR